MWGWWLASRAKPLGALWRSRALTARARSTVSSSGLMRMLARAHRPASPENPAVIAGDWQQEGNRPRPPTSIRPHPAQSRPHTVTAIAARPNRHRGPADSVRGDCQASILLVMRTLANSVSGQWAGGWDSKRPARPISSSARSRPPPQPCSPKPCHAEWNWARRTPHPMPVGSGNRRAPRVTPAPKGSPPAGPALDDGLIGEYGLTAKKPSSSPRSVVLVPRKGVPLLDI